MVKQNQKTKLWRLGVIPGLPDLLMRALRALETTVQRLQGRVESMPPQVGGRPGLSAVTLINVNAPGTIALPGMTVTFTPEQDCTALVTVNYLAQCIVFGSPLELVRALILVDGASTGVYGAAGGFTAVNHTIQVCQSWLIPFSGGKSHTLAFVAQMSGGTTTCNLLTPPSGFTYVLFPDFYQYPL